MVILQGTVFLLTRNALHGEVNRVVTAELEGLAREYNSGGLGALVYTLRSRSDSWGRTGAVYLLTDPLLRKMEGNLEAWPRDIDPRDRAEVQFRISAASEEKTHPVNAHIVQVPGVGWLLVGTDNQRNGTQPAQLRLGDGVGHRCHHRTHRSARSLVRRPRGATRARLFSATCDSIVHSDLSRRLEVGRGNDEYDQLGRTVNEMLERIEQQAVLLRAAFGSIAHDLRTPLYRLRVRLEEALLHTEGPEARELVGPALG